MEPSADRFVDLVFPVAGSSLPRDHRRTLADALEQAVPWLADLPGAATHRINTVPGIGPVALLSHRARLMLRVREAQVERLQALQGRVLDLAGHRLQLGSPHVRELLPHGTLYADFVAAPSGDEAAFLDRVDEELARMQVNCNRVCGRRQSIATSAGSLAGFSLMLFGLAPSDSRSLLETGLGEERRLGCGVFVPHRSAAAVGSG